MAFDSDAFSDWGLRQTVPVVVSEYAMPAPWVCVAAMPHRAKISATANTAVTERLFIQPRFVALMQKNTLFTTNNTLNTQDEEQHPKQ